MAWQVFEALAQRAPADVEVMESLAYNLELLLHKHWAEFQERSIRLVRSTPLLDRMVGPAVFCADHYGPRYRDLDELATVWEQCAWRS
jgi:hypothetical protein